MNDPFYEHCRALPGTTEDVKWGNNLVFSVGGKMYAVFDLPEGEPLSFKTNPEAFEILVQQPGIRPAPYLARHAWVTLNRRDVMPEDALKDLIQEAHGIVAGKLSKKLRESLGIEIS